MSTKLTVSEAATAEVDSLGQPIIDTVITDDEYVSFATRHYELRITKHPEPAEVNKGRTFIVALTMLHSHGQDRIVRHFTAQMIKEAFMSGTVNYHRQGFFQKIHCYLYFPYKFQGKFQPNVATHFPGVEIVLFDTKVDAVKKLLEA